MNNSEQYAPALLALWLIAWVSRTRRAEVYPTLLGAAGVFTLALVARSVDLHLCPVFAAGTHFLWHVMNGIVIALLLRGLIAIEPARAPVRTGPGPE